MLFIAAALAAGCATEPPKPEPKPAPPARAAAAATGEAGAAAEPKPAPEQPKPKPEPEKPKPVAEKVTFAADVLFEFDKAVVRPEGRSKLDDLSNKVRGINLEVIIAISHTDTIGSDAYNQRLSVHRAESIKAYLVSREVPANRIYTEGKGEKQPVTGNRCKNLGKEARSNKKMIDCLQADRRVEIEVIGTRRQ